MKSRADYTTPEWQTLQTAIVGVGYYVRKFTPGLLSNWRARHAAEEVIDNAEDSDIKFFDQLCDLDDFKSPYPKHAAKSTVAVEAFVLQTIDEALNILQEKDPAMLPSYKELLLAIAHETANEVNGISPNEATALQKITEVITGKKDYHDSWRISEPFAHKPVDEH